MITVIEDSQPRFVLDITDAVDGSTVTVDNLRTKVVEVYSHATIQIENAPGSGGDLNYVHTQSVAADTWNVTHNLGKFPSVTSIDSAGTVVIGEIQYDSLQAITLVFTSGFSGKAYLN